MSEVYALLNKDKRVMSLYAAEDAANAKRDRYNTDPFLEPGTTDPDAPYRVETWTVAQ